MTGSRIEGFRLGVYVFEDAEVVDFAAPYGVFSVARRHDPALEVFLVAETPRPVQAQAGFTQPPGMVPIDRLASLAPACRVSRARVVDAGRIITAAGISAGMEMGFHLLRRAGYDEAFIDDVARIMEYTSAYETYRDDRETAGQPVG